MREGGFERLSRELNAGTTRRSSPSLTDPGAIDKVFKGLEKSSMISSMTDPANARTAGFSMPNLGVGLADWVAAQNDYRESRIAERRAAGVEPSEGPIDWNAINYDFNKMLDDYGERRMEKVEQRRREGVEPSPGWFDWNGASHDIGKMFNGVFGGIGEALAAPAPRIIQPQEPSKPAGLPRTPVFDPEQEAYFDPQTGVYYRDDLREARLRPNVFPKNPEPERAPEPPVVAASPSLEPLGGIVQVVENIGDSFDTLGGLARGVEAERSRVAGTDVPLPRRDPRGYGPPAVARQDPYFTGEPPMPPSTSAPQAKPRNPVWDNAVDSVGQILDDTLLGGAVKHLFPGVWYDTGEAIKNIGSGGSGTGGAFQYAPYDSGSSSGSGASGVPAFTDFIDLNNNGVDDRLEGYKPPAPAPTAPQIDYMQAFFPTMPPYNPGVSSEWQYFKPRGYAEGGIVEAVAAESPNGVPPTGGLDPRITIIADAEDALEGEHPNPEEALGLFVEMFGPDALEMLKAQVQSGMTLRGYQRKKPRMAKGRFIEGEGGDKDDEVPARIDDVEEARLSNGEFVVTAPAVRAAGNGDPMKGAAKLSQLDAMLAGRDDDGLDVERVR